MPNLNQERIVLDRFRECWKDFPKGKIVRSESPDFIVRTGLRSSVGIELVSLPASSYVIDNVSVNDFLDDIRSSISKKEEKLRNYRKNRLNAYWLLLQADSVKAQLVNLEGHLARIGEDGVFDKVFLLAIFEGRVWEVFPPT